MTSLFYSIRLAGIRLTLVLGLVLGCGGKPFNYESQNEIPPGPGVFSGKEGEFTLYSSESKPASEDEGAGSGKTAAESAPTNPDASPESQEFREFQDFQQWKKDKADFEAFQKWKNSSQGSREYQEFLEWQRWRKYRQWQEDQKRTN